MKSLMLLIQILLLPLAFAVPERELEERYHKDVLPYFESMTAGEFKNHQGLSIKYFTLIHPENTRALVILPGRSEPAIKYAEVIFDLRHKGMNIYILSHQGQGESDRLLRDHERSYVRRFNDYIRDFSHFMNEVVLPNEKELYLLSHSMGGAISAHYLSRNPEIFQKAVLVAPMLQINTAPYTEKVARLLAKLLVGIGKGTYYAPGQLPYVRVPFEVNPTTNSEARYKIETYLFETWPNLAMGGATNRWVNESLKATKNIHLLSIKTPVLLLQAGQDLIVRSPRQDSFCRRIYSCRMKTYQAAKHEILMERDEIRNDVFIQMESFFGF